ncbi:helix-turn-helix domain-containing protein [Candidatus Atribacteria bacterium MT.SAG.1]|nr:helix-turn-helix domain-containing protein [Candidatus Atribacteria bacterium MT.SAG.1]
MGNILVKNIRKLPELSSAESRIILLLGTYYEGENPTNYELAKKTGMNKNTVKEAIKGLKKKGII